MVFRYSMIQDFLVCPKMMYEKWILKNPDTKLYASTEFGSAIHAGLKSLLEQENGIGVFRLWWESVRVKDVVYLNHSWENLRDLGLRFLENFKNRHLPKFSEFQLERPLGMTFLDGAHDLQGTIDYVGKYEGSVVVCDWKTASKAYPQNRIHTNNQLYIYAKLYETTTGTPVEKIMYKVFNKKTGYINTIEKSLTQQELCNKFMEVESIAKTILFYLNSPNSPGNFHHGASCFCQGVK